MNCRSIALYVLLALIVVMIVQVLYYYPRLPDMMASHFNEAGEPDGWSSKSSFFAILGGLIVLTALIFAGMGLWLPKLPTSIINLPQRDYWLAPERREETFRVLSEYMLWFGAVTMLLFVGMIHQIVQANLKADPRLENPWLFLAPYLAFTGVWILALIKRFQRKPGKKWPRTPQGRRPR